MSTDTRRPRPFRDTLHDPKIEPCERGDSQKEGRETPANDEEDQGTDGDHTTGARDCLRGLESARKSREANPSDALGPRPGRGHRYHC
jgi:hypothetical protein